MSTSTLPDFWGNAAIAQTLSVLAGRERLPQTLLFSGPEGVGKATAARRFAARLLGGAAQIEQDDLSLANNVASVAEREKWPADKRNDDPLLFASHPDFLTFAPDGPLRQITIEQMRLLKERAQFQPLHGNRRIFLIDRIDRANEQAANSLLKILEEPPPYLILILTAENAYDLLPTIRSRSVLFHFSPLSQADMRAFAAACQLTEVETRIALSSGSPGLAMTMDLDEYRDRRTAMLALLRAAAGSAPFADWAKFSESMSARKQDKLDLLLNIFYLLLEDLLFLHEGIADIRNTDIRAELHSLAARISFAWLRAAVRKCDELSELVRRNIQKSIALDSLVVELRRLA